MSNKGCNLFSASEILGFLWRTRIHKTILHWFHRYLVRFDSRIRGFTRTKRVNQSVSTTRCSSISTVGDGIRSMRNGTIHSSTSRSSPSASVTWTLLSPLVSTLMCSKLSTPWGLLRSATKGMSSTRTSLGKCLLQLTSGTTIPPSQHMRTVPISLDNLNEIYEISDERREVAVINKLPPLKQCQVSRL